VGYERRNQMKALAFQGTIHNAFVLLLIFKFIVLYESTNSRLDNSAWHCAVRGYHQGVLPTRISKLAKHVENRIILYIYVYRFHEYRIVCYKKNSSF
jgi:hypothetical protein